MRAELLIHINNLLDLKARHMPNRNTITRIITSQLGVSLVFLKLSIYRPLIFFFLEIIFVTFIMCEGRVRRIQHSHALNFLPNCMHIDGCIIIKVSDARSPIIYSLFFFSFCPSSQDGYGAKVRLSSLAAFEKHFSRTLNFSKVFNSKHKICRLTLL